MPKVLVTGGSGFIGSRIAENCLKAGLEVRVFDLVRSSQVDCEKIVGSILDPYEVSVAARGCDYVIHAAAALGVQRTENYRLECLYINIQGTINVLEAAVKEKVKKILFTSSSEVYGDGDGSIFDEYSALNPKSNYAITKLVGEEYLRAYNQSYGLDYAIVRFFSIYGEKQTENFVVPIFVNNVLNGKRPKIFGDGQQIRSFCHVDDAARGAVAALLSRSSGETFNIGNPNEPITISDLAKKIIEISGKKLTPEFVDFQESDRSARREIYKRIPSIEKARKTFSYEPSVTLSEGLRNILDSSPALNLK
jgi:UDP-glucose 4-epimerase